MQTNITTVHRYSLKRFSTEVFAAHSRWCLVFGSNAGNHWKGQKREGQVIRCRPRAAHLLWGVKLKVLLAKIICPWSKCNISPCLFLSAKIECMNVFVVSVHADNGHVCLVRTFSRQWRRWNSQCDGWLCLKVGVTARWCCCVWRTNLFLKGLDFTPTEWNSAHLCVQTCLCDTGFFDEGRPLLPSGRTGTSCNQSVCPIKK